MIEKKLHYIWVGENSKPNLVNICLLNWKEKLTDYEILEWSEKNFNIENAMKNNKFFKECYKRGLWAFVSDYMRVKILYENGGVYIDTDMTLLKNIEPLLNNEFFIGYEDENYISCGIFGCKKNNEFLGKVLEFYEKEIWEKDIWTIPKIFSYVLNKHPNLKNNMAIYPKEYFYPYHFTEEFSEKKITKDTYGVHWWSKNWGNTKELIFLETKHLNGMEKIFKIFKIKLRKVEIFKKLYIKFRGCR